MGGERFLDQVGNVRTADPDGDNAREFGQVGAPDDAALSYARTDC
jgi:hypothetical protein